MIVLAIVLLVALFSGAALMVESCIREGREANKKFWEKRNADRERRLRAIRRTTETSSHAGGSNGRELAYCDGGASPYP